MKRAVFYARVSSDLQQKEGTIESQVAELKRQIRKAGYTLVKEYIDDGYSGAYLDRPALEKLRADVKADIFDAIYFQCADRIAREVIHQNIIIGEILKYKKQIIINGEDYEHNPENKFTLTVLGAVAELERAKLLSRQLGKGNMTELYIEQVGYQESLIHQLSKDGFPAFGVTVGGNDKRARLASVSALIKNGTILFPEKGAELLINQITGFGVEKHDDLVDAFTILINKIFERISEPSPELYFLRSEN